MLEATEEFAYWPEPGLRASSVYHWPEIDESFGFGFVIFGACGISTDGPSSPMPGPPIAFIICRFASAGIPFIASFGGAGWLAAFDFA